MGQNNDFADFVNPLNQVQNAQVGQQNTQNYIDAQKFAEQLQAEVKAGKLDSPTYEKIMSRIGGGVGNLSQSQRDYQTTQAANAGTLGENTLASNLISNATNRQQFQQQQADELTSALANNPLTQYNQDSALKRQMAINNQYNLAKNVSEQLNQLGNARSINAELVKAAMSGGGGQQNFTNPMR